MRIVVFGRDTCAPCKQLKKYLTHKKVTFDYRDATGQEYDSIAAMHGYTVPLTVDMTTGKGVVGYNLGEINKLIS